MIVGVGDEIPGRIGPADGDNDRRAPLQLPQRSIGCCGIDSSREAECRSNLNFRFDGQGVGNALRRASCPLRDHMRLECERDWDGVIATFAHPRYELYVPGTVFYGERRRGSFRGLAHAVSRSGQ